MYAVVKTGGKQYRVTAGSIIEVEKLEGNAGSSVALEDVLTLSNGKKTVVGSPLIADAKVSAEIIGQGKGEKVIIFKKKRRHNYRRKNGHRQLVTTLHITDISFKGEALATAEPRGVTAEKKPAAKPAAKKPATAAKPAAEKKKPAAKKATTAKSTTAKTTKSTAAKKPAAKKSTTSAKKPAAKKAAE